MRQSCRSFLFVLACASLPLFACGSPDDSERSASPRETRLPVFDLSSGIVPIIPGADGRAEVRIPAGDVMLAFFPLADAAGSYSLRVTGTAWVADAVTASAVLARKSVKKTATRPDASVAGEAWTGAAELPATRAFQVPAGRNRPGNVTVQATKVLESRFAVLYAERRNGIVDEMARPLLDQFDSTIFPKSTELFGAVPDVDENGRVILLMTERVNRFSDDENAFTGGFFASKDLAGTAGSNRADMLYLYLPLPKEEGGVYEHPDDYLALLGEVIVHELQHMISWHNRRLAGADTSEESWLNEGLSHWAEEYFGYTRSNRIRARYFLESPGSTPLVGRGGTLAERGAAYLFVKYLVDSHRGEPDFLRRLVRSDARGVANVERATGKAFADLLREWTQNIFARYARTLRMETLPPNFELDVKAARSAPVFIKATGPARLFLQTSPDGDFQGVGQPLATPVAATTGES